VIVGVPVIPEPYPGRTQVIVPEVAMMEDGVNDTVNASDVSFGTRLVDDAATDETPPIPTVVGPYERALLVSVEPPA
jgi:hypothetical protein